jgi:hypothetical protein
VPSVRNRFVAAKLSSKCLKSVTPVSAVASWTIASGGGRQRLLHGRAVEQVERDRLCAKLGEGVSPGRRAGSPDHVMAALNELGNEPGADRSGRSSHEDSHRSLPSVSGRKTTRAWWL